MRRATTAVRSSTIRRFAASGEPFLSLDGTTLIAVRSFVHAVSEMEREILQQDLVVVASNATVGLMLLSAAGGLAANLWWAGALAALVTGVLVAASDRGRAGLWGLYGAGVFAAVALVWGVTTDAITIGVIAAAMLGMGVGFGLNRLLFGVVRPLPAARKRRAQTTFSDWVDRLSE